MISWLVPLPDEYVPHLTKIDFDALVGRGITHYLIDIDNTLRKSKAVPGEPEFNEACIHRLNELRIAGTMKGLVLLSNVIFPSKKRMERIRRLAQRLGGVQTVCCSFWNSKPNSWGYRRGLELLEAKPQEVAMIGDQLFTDIKGAKRFGLYAILTKPLGREAFYTAWKRPFERLILKLAQQQTLR